jgi:hypothetical protein
VNGGARAGVAGVAAAVFLFAGHQAGLVARIIGETHPWQSFGHDLYNARGSSVALERVLQKVRSNNDGGELATDLLCTIATAIANDSTPDEAVGEVAQDKLARALTGYPSLEGKLSQLSAAAEISQWNGAAAARYSQACIPLGFTHRE